MLLEWCGDRDSPNHVPEHESARRGSEVSGFEDLNISPDLLVPMVISFVLGVDLM